MEEKTSDMFLACFVLRSLTSCGDFFTTSLERVLGERDAFGSLVTSPSFCTTVSERVYIT